MHGLVENIWVGIVSVILEPIHSELIKLWLQAFSVKGPTTDMEQLLFSQLLNIVSVFWCLKECALVSLGWEDLIQNLKLVFWAIICCMVLERPLILLTMASRSNELMQLVLTSSLLATIVTLLLVLILVFRFSLTWIKYRNKNHSRITLQTEV